MTIISSKIRRNIYGDWSDVDTGFFIDNESIETILARYIGKKVKIIIVEDDENEENEELEE